MGLKMEGCDEGPRPGLDPNRIMHARHTCRGGLMKQVGVGSVTFWRGILGEIRCPPNTLENFSVENIELLATMLPMPLTRNDPSSRQTNNKPTNHDF